MSGCTCLNMTTSPTCPRHGATVSERIDQAMIRLAHGVGSVVYRIINGETPEAVREALEAYGKDPAAVTADEAAGIMCALHAQVARSPLIDNATPTDGWCAACHEGQHPGWQFENSGAALAEIIRAVMPRIANAEQDEWRRRSDIANALRPFHLGGEVEPLIDEIRRIQRANDQTF